MKQIAQTPPLFRYGDMVLSVERVTPLLAKQWLEQRNTNNRPIRQRVVMQYARDMARGDWKQKPVAICFDKNGMLGNGQHTLSAIVESGKSQDLLVAVNVDRDAIAKMDVGAKRTISEVAHFIGEKLDSKAAAITRVIAWGAGDTFPRSFDEVFEKYIEHMDVIDAVLEFGSSKQIGISSSFLAVCCRAWYQSEYRDDVRKFVEVVKTGVTSGPHESAAVRLRDYLISEGCAGAARKLESYWKTEFALKKFIERKPIGKLLAANEELFPLPREKRVKA